MRVLVVDNPSMIYVLTEFFEQFYHAETKGVEKLDNIEQVLNTFEPDLVIIDAYPNSDLAESAILRIKSIKSNPLVIVTCTSDFKFKNKPDFFLLRPFDLESIEKIISKKGIDTRYCS